MTATLLLGIDLGTSSVKALLLGVEGPGLSAPVAEATVDYPLSTPRPGWSEQDPSDWWEGVCAAIRQVVERAGAKAASIAGLALSGQMHGATLLDAAGLVLRPCILWNDQRSTRQCVEITDRLGLENLIEWVANPALPGFTAPKILWVREHEPDVYARVATVLLPKDYVNYRLTGQLCTEPSDASGTLLFDVARRRWSDDIMHALDLPAAMLPPVRESADIVGKITAEAAAETGLLEGTPAVCGGADNACAAIGVGVVEEGEVMTSLGTSATVVAPTPRLRLDPRARLHAFCHAIPDTWYLMGVVLSAGGSLRWFRDALAAEERNTVERENRDVYDLLTAEAATAPPGSEGLIFLPYLTGERSPHGDSNARGVFFGLSPRHARAHLIRSILEGVSYALADSVDIMRDLDVALDRISATGGGARSSLWRQMQADVLGAPVVSMHSSSGPALGAAILAGVGVGAVPSIRETARRIEVVEEVAPDPATHAVYESYRSVYTRLYPALRDEFERLADVVATIANMRHGCTGWQHVAVRGSNV
ncbi:MAG: xylulokinase [Chloroflexota bacterium]